MKFTLTEKIISQHLIKPKKLIKEGEVLIKVDQVLTQDATGTLVYMALESLGVKKIKPKLAVSYIDHTTPQMNPHNPDDHLYLRKISRKYKIPLSPPGNGICHQLHLKYFSQPGEILLGSDSHTPTAGAVGMLAFGAGGLDVAACLANGYYQLKMPKIVSVNLKGKLKEWVSGKDIAFELLRLLGTSGGVGKIFEYGGDIDQLNVFERSVITNMGTELGLVSSIFPCDEITLDFYRRCGRKVYKLLTSDDGVYDENITIDLSSLEPLIACPHNPGNIKTVRELEGLKIEQVCIGSCTNSSLYDLNLVANLLKGKRVHPNVDLIILPGSRNVVYHLIKSGVYEFFISSGARILEPACGPCIGMGCLPTTGGISLRTFNRNFKGRCGRSDAGVYLCGVGVAALSAIYGEVVLPERFGREPRVSVPDDFELKKTDGIIYPERRVWSKPIRKFPKFSKFPKFVRGEVVLKLGDDISTDDILPASEQTLSLRSDIGRLSRYVFGRTQADFCQRVSKLRGHKIIVGGKNFGCGSSREHAAACLRYLGIALVIAKSFAGLHRSNLINFGILPSVFKNAGDYEKISVGDSFEIDTRKFLNDGELTLENGITIVHTLTKREIKILLSGSLINLISNKLRP